MNWRNIRLVLAREIRDQLRDRRTMFMIVVLPLLLYPLLGMSFFQIAQFVRETPTRVLVIGARGLPNDPPLVEEKHFAGRLFSSPERARLLELEFAPDELRPDRGPGPDPRQAAILAVQQGLYEAAIYFPPDFGRRLEDFREALRHRARRAAYDPRGRSADLKVPLEVPKPEIIYTTANEKSQIAFAHLTQVLRRWTEEVGRSNLAAAGVPVWAATPFDVTTADVADETGIGGVSAWSKVLPVLLLIWALTGAFYPAVDLCAGEKERGTLETLLSSPAQRSEIVLGKLVTIMLFSLVTAVLNVVSILAMGQIVLGQLPGFGAPPLAGALWMAVALVPAAALFSALCLALAAFARSSKEGQYYLMPLLFITMPLAVLPVASGMDLNLGNSLIPVTGLVLLLREALQGHSWEALQFLPPVTAITLGGCFLAIRWAIEQFNSESVLFREGERLDLGLWLRHLLHDRRPTPTMAGAVFCGVVILLVHFFAGLAMPQWTNFGGFARTMLVTQVAMIATPALLMTVMLTTSPRKTLLLRFPTWPSLLAAALLAVVLHPLAHVLQAVVMYLYPVNPDVLKSLEGVQAIFTAPPLWQAVLVTAALPAVCEELAFRGFILSGFQELGHKWRAIVYSALFFGFTHGILQQSLVASLLGVVIGLLAVQTGSILPAMIFHVVHNSLLVASVRLAQQIPDGWPMLRNFIRAGSEGNLEFAWPVVTISAGLTAAILAWFQRLPRRKAREEDQRRLAQGWQVDG